MISSGPKIPNRLPQAVANWFSRQQNIWLVIFKRTVRSLLPILKVFYRLFSWRTPEMNSADLGNDLSAVPVDIFLSARLCYFISGSDGASVLWTSSVRLLLSQLWLMCVASPLLSLCVQVCEWSVSAPPHDEEVTHVPPPRPVPSSPPDLPRTPPPRLRTPRFLIWPFAFSPLASRPLQNSHYLLLCSATSSRWRAGHHFLTPGYSPPPLLLPFIAHFPSL